MFPRPGRRAAVSVIATALAALLAAGCSSSGSSPSAASSSGGTQSAGPQTVYPLTITQPDGTKAVITKPPTRVITVDAPDISVEELLALGVTPYGGEVYKYTASEAATTDPDGLAKSLHITNFVSMGTAPSTPDLETIAAAHPDLIVGVDGTETADLKQLEAIAPVLDIPTDHTPGATGLAGLPWYSEFELLAKVFDRQAQANAFLARFNTAIASARKQLAGISYALIVPRNALQTIIVDGPTFQGNLFLTAIGLTLAPMPGGQKETAGAPPVVSLSMERVDELTAPYLMINAPFANATAKDFLANPLAKRLPSVKAGHVIIIPSSGPLTQYDAGPLSQLAAVPAFVSAFKAVS